MLLFSSRQSPSRKKGARSKVVPEGPEMEPRWPKIGPGWAQDDPEGPKMEPRWPKIGPGWAQDDPR
eukprot:3084872-Karenia_brevis.AAC.1